MKSIQLNPEIFISVPDAVDQKITVNGRVWTFDYCCYSGPLWLKKSGEPRKCQFPVNKAVWEAFEQWLEVYKANGGRA